MFNGNNALIWTGIDEVFFAGSSRGFQTKKQKKEAGPDRKGKDLKAYGPFTTDVYVYKYSPDYHLKTDCLFIEKPDALTFWKNTKYISDSEVAKSGLYSLRPKNYSVKLERKDGTYVIRKEKSHGGYKLMGQMKTPRPCAYFSTQLT